MYKTEAHLGYNDISLEQLKAFDHPLPLLGDLVLRRRFKLNVNIENGFNVIGYRAEINFGTSTLTCCDFEYSDYLEMEDKYHPDKSLDLPIRIVTIPKHDEHDKITASDGDGVLATITFECPFPEPKPTSITLSNTAVIISEAVVWLSLIHI